MVTRLDIMAKEDQEKSRNYLSKSYQETIWTYIMEKIEPGEEEMIEWPGVLIKKGEKYEGVYISPNFLGIFCVVSYYWIYGERKQLASCKISCNLFRKNLDFRFLWKFLRIFCTQNW